jgi:hypothetical protein
MAASGSRSEVSVLHALRKRVVHPDTYDPATVAQQDELLRFYATEAKEKQDADDEKLAETVQLVAGEPITTTECQIALLAVCAKERITADEGFARKLQAKYDQEAADARLARELSRNL